MNNRLESSKIFVHLYAPDSLHFTYTVALLHFLYMYIFIYAYLVSNINLYLPIRYAYILYYICTTYMYVVHVCTLIFLLLLF